VDSRARDLTIKGQEILTGDKVAIRVSILVQFAVIDPKAAVHAVADNEDRLDSDVQLAARRSLAAMNLEEILTNRHRLSEDILRDVKEAAAGYGVAIARADVKDLVISWESPGDHEPRPGGGANEPGATCRSPNQGGNAADRSAVARRFAATPGRRGG
jgi:hypothetical protein